MSRQSRLYWSYTMTWNLAEAKNRLTEVVNLALRPRTNIRVTSRHLDHLSGNRVVISSSKLP